MLHYELMNLPFIFLFFQHFFTSFGARDRTYMMMFRLWQNALLEKVRLTVLSLFCQESCWCHNPEKLARFVTCSRMVLLLISPEPQSILNEFFWAWFLSGFLFAWWRCSVHRCSSDRILSWTGCLMYCCLQGPKITTIQCWSWILNPKDNLKYLRLIWSSVFLSL